MSAVNFDDEDEIIRAKIQALVKEFKGRIGDLLRDYFKDGNLEVNEELAFLDSKIFENLKDSGINDIYAYILSVYERLNVENIAYYANLTKLKNDIAKSESIKFVTDNLKVNLVKQGLKTKLASQIANTIRPFILSNADYKTTSQVLKKVVPLTVQKYVTNLTKGTFAIYDGAIQTTVIDNYNPKAFYYAGSLIETSRPFCVHMKNKYGGKPITWKELQEDLDEFCPNGVPSEVMVENLKGKMVKKGSGMHPGTTVATFPLYCGGHEEGCNHQVNLIFV